ncbi:MAG: membrane protein insertase YidC [candidate division WOR-3 bacterium]
MDETKRLILGFVLIFIVMWLFQLYTTQKKERVEEPPIEETSKEVISQKEEKIAELVKGKVKVMKDSSKLIKVETKLMNVYLSSFGGVVDSIYLKDYKVRFSPLNREGPFLSTSIIMGGKPIPLSLLPFKVEIKEGKNKKVIFSYTLDSIILNKTYTFEDSSYIVHLECSPKSKYLYEISAFETGEKFSREDYYSGVVYYAGGKAYHIKKGNLLKGLEEPFSGLYQWVGYKTKYFFGGFVPEDYIEDFTLKKSPKNPVLSIQAEDKARFYFGPLKYSILASVKKGFEDAIYFGWALIRPIAKFIYHFMQFLHNRVSSNYGVVVILFAFCLNFVFIPLTIHQAKSIGRMSKLQPKLQEIKRKYKDDPHRMNQEVINLYREIGFNPFSGCLTSIFLQMPIFISLFQVLNSSIELKGAPFALWIRDLSVRDPYFVFPVLTGISIFFQQRITSPQTHDEQQRMMSYMTPVFITAIFLTLPSGLTLYFFTYNILTLVTQILIKRRLKEV